MYLNLRLDDKKIRNLLTSSSNCLRKSRSWSVAADVSKPDPGESKVAFGGINEDGRIMVEVAFAINAK